MHVPHCLVESETLHIILCTFMRVFVVCVVNSYSRCRSAVVLQCSVHLTPADLDSQQLYCVATLRTHTGLRTECTEESLKATHRAIGKNAICYVWPWVRMYFSPE